MEDQNEQIQARRQKLAQLRERGCDPFAAERFERSHTASEARSLYEALEDGGNPEDIAADQRPEVRLAGRLLTLRPMGRAAFADFGDASGRIQLYFRKNVIGEEAFAQVGLMDTGDIVGVRGHVFRTRTGEVTVQVDAFELLSKALRPLPIGKDVDGELHGDLRDIEQRYRQRYVDLAVHPDVQENFRTRGRIMQYVRRFFDDRGYLEVETPVLQSIAGGASARPFETHHNALNLELHLRISLELPLKRLIVGGLEKVYEIGRVFRNEGVSTRHNPEFTLLESYEAFADLEDIEKLVEELVYGLVVQIRGEPKFVFQGEEIDVNPPWKRLPLLQAIEEQTGLTPDAFDSFESARAAGAKLGLNMEKETHVGGIMEKLLERFVQPTLVQPTFITDFPIETSPLAKKHPDNPRLTRRFEPYIARYEIGNAFSEINDPDDQRERFQAQLELKEAGEEETHPMDEDFIRALEYGMPPTGGLGIGLDRLVMLLTDTTSIRDVILFPQMRPLD